MVRPGRRRLTDQDVLGSAGSVRPWSGPGAVWATKPGPDLVYSPHVNGRWRVRLDPEHHASALRGAYLGAIVGGGRVVTGPRRGGWVVDAPRALCGDLGEGGRFVASAWGRSCRVVWVPRVD